MVIVNDRDKLDWKPGMTVQDLLDAMRYDFSMMTVTVDDILVPSENYRTHEIPDNARVSVFHLAHGG
ncbi:MAG: sulfur carrier protein ThiS [Oligoflexales bacterium]|nr:sulfur carrier protein ThiS [Oligoflexales bacterium]